VLNCVFSTTKIEILFYICFFLTHSFVINKNNFSLEIELVNFIKNLISLYIVKNLISLIVDKSFASSNVAKNLIFFEIAKTSISLNSLTTLDRSIFVKITFILTNFLFKFVNFVYQLDINYFCKREFQ